MSRSQTAPAPATPVKAAAPVWAVAFSPDGKTLAAAGYKQVQLWDVAAQQPLKTLTGLSGPVRSLAWSADGTRLAAGSGLPGESGEVGVFTLPDGGAPKLLKTHKDVVESLAFPPSGDALLSASIDEKAMAVDLGTGRVLKAMQDHTNRVVAIAVSPKGKYIATGSLDKTVKIWGPDYLPLANIDNTGGQIYSLTFLTDTQLAAAGEDGNVRLFNLNEGRSGKLVTVNASLARTLNGNRTPVFTVATRSNLLVYGGEDHVVRAMDLSNGKRFELKESPEAIYSLSISPDGSLLAAGCRDGKVRTWTLKDGKLATELATN